MSEIELNNYSEAFIKRAVTFYIKFLDGSIADEIKEELKCQS